MDFSMLSDEQKAKVEACKTPEEMLELAKSEGYELSDEDLSAVAGGTDWAECPDDTNTGPY